MIVKWLTLDYYQRTGVQIPVVENRDRIYVSGLNRWLPQFNGVIFVVVGVAMLIYSLATYDLGPAAFAALWLIAMLWILQGSLVHGVWMMVLDDTQLYWKSALRTGRIPLVEIMSIEQRRASGGGYIIHAESGRRLALLTSPGFPLFLAELRTAAPHVVEWQSVGFMNSMGEQPDGWSSLPRSGTP